jgi:hypothetical protein
MAVLGTLHLQSFILQVLFNQGVIHSHFAGRLLLPECAHGPWLVAQRMHWQVLLQAWVEASSRTAEQPEIVCSCV